MLIIIMSLDSKKHTRRFLTSYRLSNLSNINLLNYLVFLKFFFSLYKVSQNNTKVIFLYSFLFYRLYNIKQLLAKVTHTTDKVIPFFLNKKQNMLYNLYSVIYALSPIKSVTEYNLYNKNTNYVNSVNIATNNNTHGFELSQLEYINNELTQFEIFFLRKNRVFNKGRYSRNRQNYRTGVYICFYLSIASIFGLYYTFYRFSFNLSYLWFGFIFFVGSFFFSKLLRYNL